MCVFSVASVFLTLCDPMDYSPPGSSVHGDSPGKNMVGLPVLLQGIFPTHGLNICLCVYLHWQVGSSPPAPPGKPLLSLEGQLFKGEVDHP